MDRRSQYNDRFISAGGESENSRYLTRTGRERKKPNVGIMTGENFQRSGETPLGNLIELVYPLTNRIFVIAGGGDYYDSTRGIEVIRIKTSRRRSVIARVFQQVLTHLRVLLIIAKLRKDIDVLLYIFGPPFPIPLLFAQALNVRCFIILATQGSEKRVHALKESGAPRQFGELTRLRTEAALERISYYFADKLIVYSPSVADQMKLRRYRKKTVVAHRHFVNFDEFRFEDNIEMRAHAVGYVGRLSEEKGILNFVKAIPKILSVRDDVTFFIIGEGNLEDEIRTCLNRYALRANVKILGWIPHSELPDHIRSLKLLILPSYSEGLPNVMLEAMACGTPIVATSVGSIPDVITDNETGFLVRDNSPSHLAETILEKLASPDLKRVAINARNLVQSNFCIEEVTETWEGIICDTKGG